MRHVRSFGVLVLATGFCLATELPALAQSRLLHPEAVFRIVGLSGKSAAAGYLGVDLRDVSEDRLASLKMKDTHGAEVVGVDHDAPACKAGIQLHDVILQMNGQAIEGETQLRRMLRETPAGRQVTFVISRDGQQKTIQTQLADRDEVERQAWDNHYTVPEPPSMESGRGSVPRAGNSFLSSSKARVLKDTHAFLGTSMLVSSSYTGAKLEVMGPQLAEFFGAQGTAGLLVRSVEPHSPAADAGMKAGDVVVKVNSIEIAGGSDWSKTIHDNRGKSVNIVVLRDKKTHSLTLVPDSRKRSSVEPWANLEDFFGNSPQALETRNTLAQLEPVLDAMGATLRNSLEEVRDTPAANQMNQLMARLNAWSSSPEFHRQIEITRSQVMVAADRMRQEQPALRNSLNTLHDQLRNTVRLD